MAGYYTYLDLKLEAMQCLQGRRVQEGAVGRAGELDEYLRPAGHRLRHRLPAAAELEEHCVPRRVAVVYRDVVLHVIALRPHLPDSHRLRSTATQITISDVTCLAIKALHSDRFPKAVCVYRVKDKYGILLITL